MVKIITEPFRVLSENRICLVLFVVYFSHAYQTSSYFLVNFRV